MSRSGSMWTYNVLRALLTCAKKMVLPRDIPPDESPLIEEAFLSPQQENVFYCIKTHKPMNPNLPNAKIICNYRDVRESMLSYMQFMHCDFERGLEIAEGMMLLTDFYFEQHTNNIIRIRYDRIISDPERVIGEVAQFLDLYLPIEDVSKIAQQFSKTNIKKFIGLLNSIKPDTYTLHPELQEDFELVPNLDGSFRIYHKKTAYQSNHITGKGDNWRKELTAEQKERLMELTSNWLTKYHFVL